MQFSYELNDRQTARVLEQAIRTGLTVRMDPHYSSGLEPFAVQLLSDDQAYLTFRLLPDQCLQVTDLTPGLFCQAQLHLPGGIYMLSTYILDVDTHGEWLRAARPQVVQILERRKFVRTKLAQPTAVTIHWPDGRQAETSLFNICGGGLALCAARDVAEGILVGELMAATFTMPGASQPYRFPIIICNKTVASDERNVIIGVQFQVDESDEQASGWLAELRRILVSQQQGTLSR